MVGENRLYTESVNIAVLGIYKNKELDYRDFRK